MDNFYVILCNSGIHWLVEASSAVEALNNWQADVDDGSAEPAYSARSPVDREEIEYLQSIGQSDA